MNLFERANDAIRLGESSLVNLLSAIAPWGAPLAPAYMSYAGMIRHLAYPAAVAFIVAAVIEVLGLATVHTTLSFWRHNRRYSRDYRQMPTLLAAAMFLLYLVIVLSVNVLLEWPTKSVYTPILARALLSFLSVPAAVTMAIRAQHTELLHEIREGRARRTTPVETSLPFVDPTEAFRYRCDCGYETNDQRSFAGHRSAEARAKSKNGHGAAR